ncbi:3-isopropylmalate dehydratase small subunit [Candidatus Gottesmanbacteria bacterium]|nr:3-isopropylmalate dehydratase small subunit [Candidatus Gottesmanbacteria bacterium]
MKKFTKIASTCLPIETENIDTDQIVPARFLKITTREGFGKYLFYDWRFDKNGKPKENKYFDYSNNRSIKILVAGNNFGCGSSREHAVWALQDFGFETIISSSFGDIFYNNCLKNALLPVVLKPVELNKLFKILEKNSKTKITIDLIDQEVIVGDNYIFSFPIDNFRKTCLLKGVDELGYIFSHEKNISAFERRHQIFISR